MQYQKWAESRIIGVQLYDVVTELNFVLAVLFPQSTVEVIFHPSLFTPFPNLYTHTEYFEIIKFKLALIW